MTQANYIVEYGIKQDDFIVIKAEKFKELDDALSFAKSLQDVAYGNISVGNLRQERWTHMIKGRKSIEGL